MENTNAKDQLVPGPQSGSLRPHYPRLAGDRRGDRALVTLNDGSVLAGVNQYRVYNGRVYVVGQCGVLDPAFGGLRLHRGEPLEHAVKRGLAGERGVLPRLGVGPLVLSLLGLVILLARHIHPS